ncbi:MAG TPA: hypothetical protein VH112_11765 [Acidimicrobiales bacterium]|nr:hypothetical protein [Acidimicrobiales bacterium]
MKSSSPTSSGDVIDLLQHEDSEIGRLFDEFFSSGCALDEVRRGVVGKELVDHLSMQDAANEQIARTLLGDMGRADLAEQLARHSCRHRRLVGELDDISAGVSPRDIRRSAGRRFDGLITELRDLRREQIGFEVEHVIPTIRYRMSPQRRERLAGDIDRVRRRATIRPVRHRELAPSGLAPSGLRNRIRDAIHRVRGAGRAQHLDAG